MVVQQGDIYWYTFGSPRGSAPAKRRPVVVVQSDLFNETALGSTVVCVITRNLTQAQHPGNVRLAMGEGGLPRPSVVNVMQIATVDKDRLKEHVGRLSAARLQEIYDGLTLVLRPALHRRV